MNYRAACHSPSIFLGICLLGSDFICCAARAGWAPLPREVGDSTSGLCRQFPAESGDSPAPSCPVCPIPIISWTTNTTPEAALKAELVHLHSLLIFLSFWLCCGSKILFAGHHLASLAPGQQVSLCNRAFAPNQRHSQGQGASWTKLWSSERLLWVRLGELFPPSEAWQRFPQHFPNPG